MFAQVIELRPTPEQEVYFRRCSGTMRFVYNQLVEKVVKNKEKYNRKTLQKFSSILRQNTPWMQEVTARATYEAVDTFHSAMKNFFDSCKGKRKGRKVRPPKFKAKGVKESFRFTSNKHFKVEGRKLKIQGLKTKILMREKLHLQGEVKQVTIKLRAGKWFASFLVECNLPKRVSNTTMREPSVGVDLGLSTFATLSNGSKFLNPRPMKRRLRLLKRRQRQLSHKKKQSNRQAIARLRVAKIHKKVSDYRKEFHHEVVNYLVENFDRVVIEDLAVSNMVKNKRLARSIADVGWSNFRNILTYKCSANETELIIADRYFASSKTCSCCGHKVESLELSTRVFECPLCEHEQDRDLNASINLCYYNTTSLTVRERSKTYILDQGKTFSKAGLLEGVNYENKS